MIIPTGPEFSVELSSDDIRLEPDDYLKAPISYQFAYPNLQSLPSSEIDLPLPVEDVEVDDFNRKLISGYELLYDSPEQAWHMLMMARQIADEIGEASICSINIGEKDVGKKLSIQRRYPQKYYLERTKLSEGNPSSLWLKALDSYVRWISRLNKRYRNMNFIELMLRDSDPMTTNQGYPTFSDNPDLRIATVSSLNLKDRKVSTIVKSLKEISNILGYPSYMQWPAAVAKRSGPLVKSQPYYENHPDGLSARHRYDVTGGYCRGRKVYMMPFWFNMLVSPVAYAMKQGRIATLGFGHHQEGEDEYLTRFHDQPDFTIVESDLSGFDMSVQPAYRKALWTACRKYGYDKDSLDLLDEFELNSVVLSGPWNDRQRGLMGVVKGRMGLLSGLKVTTEVGSALSAATCAKAMVETGICSEKSLETGFPFFLMLSDDILLKIPSNKFSPDKFKQSYAEEGFKVELLEGRRFLMNHIKDGVKYGVTSRVIQQTMFNEDSYSHEGQIYLGLASRLSKPVVPDHLSLLKRWANLMVQSKLPDPFKMIRDNDMQDSMVSDLLNHPSVPLFLESAKGQIWIEQITAKNALSNAYSDILQLLFRKFKLQKSLPFEYRKILVSKLLAPTTDDMLIGRRELVKSIIS